MAARSDVPGRILAALAGALLVAALVGSLWMIVTVTVVAAVAITAAPRTRARLGAGRRRRVLRAARDRREAQLEDASAPREDHRVLAETVERLEREAAPEALDRDDLDALLDAHAELTILRHRHGRVLALADRASIVDALAAVGDATSGAAALRRACLEQRLRQWDACRAAVDRCTAELAAIGELIRMLGERALIPPMLAPTVDLAQRLDDLVDEDRAMRELADDSMVAPSSSTRTL